MANTVIAIRSSGVTGNTPSLGVLSNGELSLNFADGILYYKSSSNTLGSIRTTAVSGLTTEVQFNDAGSFGANANFTFNKTLATLNVKNINVSTNLIATNANLTVNNITTGTGVGGIIAGANVIYSNTFIANTGGITTAGNSTLNGIVTVNYNVGAASSQNVAIEMYGANTKGGTGYFDFLTANNISAGTTNRNKWFRVDSNGKFQIINSAYTTNIFDLNDSGYLTIPGGLATSQYIQFSDGSRQYTANAGGALSNTQILAGLQTVSPTANITFDTMILANNNNGRNLRIGDDAWIGDVNLSDTIAIRGAFNAANAYIVFGNADATSLGRAGSGPLTYGGGFAATYIQFGDGTKQYTANAGSGGSGTTDYGFGQIFTPNNSVYANASSANDKVTFVGESGVYVFANSTTKTITVAGTPGAQGMTVDYGYVSEAVFYSVDYGTL